MNTSKRQRLIKLIHVAKRELGMADDLQSNNRALWLDLHAKGAVRNPSEAALASFAKRI